MAHERIIEGTWRCTSCGTEKILARHVRCTNCNNPREQADNESDFDFGARTEAGGLQAQAVADEALVARANAGADWACAFCKTSNAATRASCSHCGASRDMKAGDAQVKDLPPIQAQPPAVAAPPPKRTGRRIAIGCGSLFVLLIGFIILATRTHEVTAAQASATWEHSAHRETFTQVVASDWRDKLTEAAPVMPVNGKGEVPGVANIRDCRREQRGTQKVADGTEQHCEMKKRQVQCGTTQKCSVKDLGNGFAKETCRDIPKYCSESYESCSERTRYRNEPVYADKCTYDTFEWKRVESATKSGSTEAPTWPELAVGPRDRIVREGHYKLEFAYTDDGESHTYAHEPKTQDEFLRLRDQEQVKLEVGTFGNVGFAQSAP